MVHCVGLTVLIFSLTGLSAAMNMTCFDLLLSCLSSITFYMWHYVVADILSTIMPLLMVYCVTLAVFIVGFARFTAMSNTCFGFVVFPGYDSIEDPGCHADHLQGRRQS